MISLFNKLIYDIMISSFMKTQPTLQTKLADWTEAFNSMSDKQTNEAQILQGLVSDLKRKIMLEGITVIPGVA